MTLAPEKLGVIFTLHTCDYGLDADGICPQAAEPLGMAPGRKRQRRFAQPAIIKSLVSLE
jgi:hypothetical protein